MMNTDHPTENVSLHKAKVFFRVQLAHDESLCSQDFSEQDLDNVIGSRTLCTQRNSISNYMFSGKSYEKLKIGLYPKLTSPDSFKETDILQKQSFESPAFYIFDSNKYKPSDNKTELKSARKLLQNDLNLAAKRTGSSFFSSSLKCWGGKTSPKTFQNFEFRCSMSVMKPVSIIDEDNNLEDYKMASTNNTRALHGRYKGHKNKKRKCCK